MIYLKIWVWVREVQFTFGRADVYYLTWSTKDCTLHMY